MFYFLVLVQIVDEIFGNFSTCFCQFSGMLSGCLLNEDGIGSVNNFLNTYHIPEQKGSYSRNRVVIRFSTIDLFFSVVF